jgi:hypothetical protein
MLAIQLGPGLIMSSRSPPVMRCLGSSAVGRATFGVAPLAHSLPERVAACEIMRRNPQLSGRSRTARRGCRSAHRAVIVAQSCSRIGESPGRLAAASSWGHRAVPPRRSLAGVTILQGIPAAPLRRPIAGCPLPRCCAAWLPCSHAALAHCAARLATPSPLSRSRVAPGPECADAARAAEAFHAVKPSHPHRCSPQPARPTHPLAPPP